MQPTGTPETHDYLERAKEFARAQCVFSASDAWATGYNAAVRDILDDVFGLTTVVTVTFK